MEKTIKKFNELAKVILDHAVEVGITKEIHTDIGQSIRVWRTATSGTIYLGKYNNCIECRFFTKQVIIDSLLLSKKSLETHYTEMMKEWESVKDSLISKGEQAKLDRIEQLKKELELLDPSFAKFSSEIMEELHNEQ